MEKLSFVDRSRADKNKNREWTRALTLSLYIDYTSVQMEPKNGSRRNRIDSYLKSFSIHFSIHLQSFWLEFRHGWGIGSAVHGFCVCVECLGFAFVFAAVFYCTNRSNHICSNGHVHIIWFRCSVSQWKKQHSEIVHLTYSQKTIGLFRNASEIHEKITTHNDIPGMELQHFQPPTSPTPPSLPPATPIKTNIHEACGPMKKPLADRLDSFDTNQFHCHFQQNHDICVFLPQVKIMCVLYKIGGSLEKFSALK